METIHKSNLAIALYECIKLHEKSEKEQGYSGNSGFTAGLKESLKALQENNLKIQY